MYDAGSPTDCTEHKSIPGSQVCARKARERSERQENRDGRLVAGGKSCWPSRWLLRAFVLRHRRRLFRVRLGRRLVEDVLTGLDEAQLLARFFLDGAGIGSLQEVNLVL